MCLNIRLIKINKQTNKTTFRIKSSCGLTSIIIIVNFIWLYQNWMKILFDSSTFHIKVVNLCVKYYLYLFSSLQVEIAFKTFLIVIIVDRYRQSYERANVNANRQKKNVNKKKFPFDKIFLKKIIIIRRNTLLNRIIY